MQAWVAIVYARCLSGARFIVLEGIDGSGTTTQCAALATALAARGHEAISTCEPSDGSVGQLIRRVLAATSDGLDAHALALLFAADRMDHVARVIRPALVRGCVVVCDRYLLSSWAYQSLDCPRAWVETINAQAPWPDRTFILATPADVAFARVKARQRASGGELERFEVPELQRRLADHYAAYASDTRLADVTTVDGSQSPAIVAAELLRQCIADGL